MVTLRALNSIEDHPQVSEFEIPGVVFMGEIEKGLHDKTKRPISAILNHCEILDAPKDILREYDKFSMGVKVKSTENDAQGDPFRKEKA